MYSDRVVKLLSPQMKLNPMPMAVIRTQGAVNTLLRADG